MAASLKRTMNCCMGTVPMSDVGFGEMMICSWFEVEIRHLLGEHAIGDRDPRTLRDHQEMRKSEGRTWTLLVLPESPPIRWDRLQPNAGLPPSPSEQSIPRLTDLRSSGIKLEPKRDDSFLEISFQNRLLGILTVNFSVQMESS